MYFDLAAGFPLSSAGVGSAGSGTTSLRLAACDEATPKRFDLVDKVKDCRVYERYINAHTSHLVLTFRKSLEPMLESLPPAALEGAVAIWSQWHGYLDRDAGAPTLNFCRRHGIPLVEHHTSGHARLEELRKLAVVLDPRSVVPIHTEAPEVFARYFPKVEVHADGESWEV
jgi:ribonuclease J